jgi:hypothetical protein
MSRNRRALVLTDESVRHPFRMTLPPHVRSGARAVSPRPRMPAISTRDWRDFFAAYCATFIVVMIFIA